MNFEHNATTTRLFAGAMGEVEVEVTACRCRTKDVPLRVDCNVIVLRLSSVSRAEEGMENCLFPFCFRCNRERTTRT